LEAEQVLAYDNPSLLPFVPLMRGGNTEQMIGKCAERIRQEPEAAELETILAVFAEYVLDRKLIQQLLRWEMEIVRESSIIKELIQEGYEKGERKATIDALHQTLTIRFNIEPGKFDEQFEQLDVASLKKLHEAALTVQSLAEFERALAEMSQD
jgi:predicted transposase YdaD